MLLQRLVELRQRDDIDAQVPKAHHKSQKLDWQLELDGEGRFVQWLALGTKEETPYKKRQGVRPPPLLLVDKHSYILGLPAAHELPKDEAAQQKLMDKYATKLEDYTALTHQLLDTLPEGRSRAKIEAFVAFLDDESERQRAIAQAPPKLKEGQLVVPSVEGVALHRLVGVAKFWKDLVDASASDAAGDVLECMVCGAHRPIPKTHPIELKMGPERPSLVSANKRAFESYGLRQAMTSPVCWSCASDYGEALRYLLGSDASRLRVANTHYVYWTREEVGFDLSSWLSSPDPEQVKRLLQRPFTGRGGESTQPNDFYAVALTNNASRLVVRDWIETTLPSVQEHLARWFERQQLRDAGEDCMIEPQGVFALAASTTHDADKMSPRIVPGLLNAALRGGALPRELLTLALRRVRADRDYPFTRPRAVLIRMALNDLLSAQEEPEVPPELDPNDRRQGYLYGRLFATLESIQRAALGQTNATITDRFYGTASSAPRSVFPTLLRGAQAHLQKLRKTNGGAHHRLQLVLEALMAGIDAFDRTLNMEQQGLFALGYYHQRGEFSRQIAEARAEKARQSEASSESDD